MESIGETTGAILGVLAVIGVIVVGAVALWGVIDRKIRDRRKEALDGADDVINILKEKVEVLTTRVNDLEDEQEEHIRQIRELKATNETLTRILQGRDEATLAFQREVLASVKISGETNGMVRNVETQVGKMADAMTRLAQAIEGQGK